MRFVENLAASLAAMQDPVAMKEYREWAASPATARFVGIVAEILNPPPLSDADMKEPVLVASALVRREVLEAFVDTIPRLDRMAAPAAGAMPAPDYGADQMLLEARQQLAAVLRRPDKTPRKQRTPVTA